MGIGNGNGTATATATATGNGNGNGGATRQGQTRKTLASSNPKIGNLSFMNLQNSRRLYQNKLIRPGVGVEVGVRARNLELGSSLQKQKQKPKQSQTHSMSELGESTEKNI